MDMNTLDMRNIDKLDTMLKVSRTLADMEPRSKKQKMIDWMVEQLRHYNMFNTYFVFQREMEKNSLC